MGRITDSRERLCFVVNSNANGECRRVYRRNPRGQRSAKGITKRLTRTTKLCFGYRVVGRIPSDARCVVVDRSMSSDRQGSVVVDMNVASGYVYMGASMCPYAASFLPFEMQCNAQEAEKAKKKNVSDKSRNGEDITSVMGVAYTIGWGANQNTHTRKGETGEDGARAHWQQKGKGQERRKSRSGDTGRYVCR
jgi:hypothetical protein